MITYADYLSTSETHDGCSKPTLRGTTSSLKWRWRNPSFSKGCAIPL